MGVFAQQVGTRRGELVEGKVIPIHLQGLVQEFLRRYDELQGLRKKELSWMVILTTVGSLSLWGLMLVNSPFYLTTILLGFMLVLRQYLRMRKLSHRVYVNVHILYHHLLGKLEVGFCHHVIPCQCADDFKKYFWRTYGISFYTTSI